MVLLVFNHKSSRPIEKKHSPPSQTLNCFSHTLRQFQIKLGYAKCICQKKLVFSQISLPNIFFKFFDSFRFLSSPQLCLLKGNGEIFG